MTGYELNPKQRAFIFDPGKFTGYYGGIRNGKTFAGVLKSLLLAEAFPFNLGVIARQTYRELEDTTGKIALDIIKRRNGGTLDPGPYIKKYDKNPDTITLYNDSQLMFRHMANIEGVLGMDLGFFWLDQAEFIAEDIYDQLEGRLSRWGSKGDNVMNIAESKRIFEEIHGRPYDGPPHRAFGFITGNPAPGWVKRRYKKLVDLNGVPYPPGTYRLYEASTAENIKNLGEEYIADLRRTHTQTWVDRYIEGSWETQVGQVYEDFSRSLHVIPPFDIPKHWPRHIGWDHGSVNPTSVSWIAVDENGNFVLYREYYEVSIVIKEHAEKVLDLCKHDAVQRGEDGRSILVWMDPATAGDKDPTSGRNFMELYRELGILGLKANKEVRAGIQKVASLFRPDPTHPFPKWHPRAGQLGSPRLFFFSTCHASIHEHELYHYPQRKLGEEKNALEEPEKYLDHTCDSVRYAIFSVYGKAEEPAPPPKKGHDAYLDGVYKKLLRM